MDQMGQPQAEPLTQLDQLYQHTKPRDVQPDRQDMALLKKHQKRVKEAYDSTENSNLRKRWKKAREYVGGEVNGDGEKGLVRVNLIHSHLAALQPQLYAKSPEIGVTPKEGLQGTQLESARKFCATLEKLLNAELVKAAKLKKRGKKAVRGALTTNRSWAKISYQREYENDPLIKNRMNDVQDNIARIQHLLSESQENGEEQQEALAELKLQLQALEKQVEVQVSEGLVVDILPADDVFILDSGVKEIDSIDNACAIAHRVMMEKEEYEARFKIECDDAVEHYAKNGEAASEVNKNGMVVVWEVWDRQSQTVYTFAQGAKVWAREPYQPVTMGETWFPFFPLQFHRIDETLTPPSLVDMLIELQDEYNDRRTNGAEHRRKNKPVRLLNTSSGITEDQVNAINNRSSSTDIIGVNADPNVPMQNQLGSLPEIPYNPQMYDASDIFRDMEMISGASDASRGSINKAKTATEAEIMSMGLQSRTGEALDVVETWLSDIANFAAQMLLQEMTAEQVSQVIGEPAFWPELSKEETFRLANINIRAGSTAKPNKSKEREQWGTLLPTLMQLVQQIAMAESQGNMGFAQALRKLGEETLKRYDEHMRFEELLPPAQQALPVVPPDMQQLPIQTNVPAATSPALMMQ